MEDVTRQAVRVTGQKAVQLKHFKYLSSQTDHFNFSGKNDCQVNEILVSFGWPP